MQHISTVYCVCSISLLYTIQGVFFKVATQNDSKIVNFQSILDFFGSTSSELLAQQDNISKSSVAFVYTVVYAREAFDENLKNLESSKFTQNC